MKVSIHKTKMQLQAYLLLILFCLPTVNKLLAESNPVKVGIAAIMSGDMAIYGEGDYRAAQTYLKYYGRHNIHLLAEDARLSSIEGLQAYQKLINVDRVDLVIAAGTSNGIMAANPLFNKTKTVSLAASTGGKNIDQAGAWLFRIGNSDSLNGIQQADRLISDKITKVAVLTELTEYTVDISDAFKTQFLNAGGKLVYEQNFLPQTNDFRSQITQILKAKPQALFMPTQTGTALGVFLKQLKDQLATNQKFEIHTTMVAAHNPDAHKIAGAEIIGVKFMDPSYSAQDQKFIEFLKKYQQEYQSQPSAIFHAAAVIDCLELLQLFLDKHKKYNNELFKNFLDNDLGKYCGFLGCFELDQNGNSNVGFSPNVIK